MTVLFQSICHMSLAGTYVLLIVLAARLLLRKCPRKYTYFLWILVFLRFACPIFPEGPVSLFPASNVRVKAEIGMEQIMSQGSAFGMEHRNEKGRSGRKDIEAQTVSYAEKADEDMPDALKENGPDTTERLQSFLFDFWMWLPYVWALGAAVFLLYHVLSYIRLKWRLSSARQSEPGVYETDWSNLSFVAGLIHPAIYISKDLAPEARAVILCHERVHRRRKDYLIKPAALVICCMHWFNPFVWLAFRLMHRDMEISCDEQVLEELGERSKETYSRALLNVAKEEGTTRVRRGSRCTMLSFGENSVKQRIHHMLTYRQRPFWMAAVSAAVLVLLTAGLLMNPKAGGMTEADMIRIVQIAGGYGEDSSAHCFARDYDGDGKTEGYVEIGHVEEGYIRGDFWFVSSEGRPQQIRKDILMEMEQAYFEQENEVYLLMSYMDGNPLLTDVYSVYDGSWTLWELPFSEQKYVENGTLMCVVSDYDMSYDMEMDTFAGHTQKAYPYYYEKYEDALGVICEYEAEEISREDVKGYENGKEILQAIENASPGCRYEYLLRGNGMLHINQVQADRDFLTFAYTTFQAEGSRLTLIEEGEGCYRKSLLEYEYGETDEMKEESFAERLAKEYSEGGYDPEEQEYRGFAEEVRHCLENEDVDGLYGRMAEEVFVFGDEFLEKNMWNYSQLHSDIDDAAFVINSRNSLKDYYDEIFTPEVKDLIFRADVGEVFMSNNGVVQIMDGEYGLIASPVDGTYRITQIRVK